MQGSEKCHRLCSAGGVILSPAGVGWEGDVLSSLKTKWTNFRLWPAVLIATFALALVSGSAHAQQTQGTYFNFKSLLSVDNANWCMDVPGAAYMAGTQLTTAACTGGPDQTFGYENGVNLTAGGFCVDGVPPAYAAVLAECDQSEHQAWALVPFQGSADVFAIVNSDGACLTVGGPIGDGTPITLTQCAEEASQGWVFYVPPQQVPRPVYVPTYPEPQYFWRGGSRYCWYDDGWMGAGWYICGDNLVAGVGYGGPIGWFGWVIPGQPIPFYPTLRPTFFPPTFRPTFVPTFRPTFRPTLFPTLRPTLPPPTIRPTIPPPPTIRPTRPTLPTSR